MPYACVVPNCKGNYRSGPKVHVFAFPKNEELTGKWIGAIKRENFTPTKNSRVSPFTITMFYFRLGFAQNVSCEKKAW